MAMFPIDIFDLLLDLADCPTINSLARSCRALALRVGVRADELADRHVIIFDDMSPRQLPNGTLHSTTYYDESTGESTIAIEFVRGTPTHWCIVYSEDGAIWGCRDCCFTLECDSTPDIACGRDFTVFARFNNGGFIRATARGGIYYALARNEPHRKLTDGRWQPKLAGCLVDGRMNAEVVTRFMTDIINRVIAHTGRPNVFARPRPHVLHISNRDVCDVLGQLDTLEIHCGDIE